MRENSGNIAIFSWPDMAISLEESPAFRHGEDVKLRTWFVNNRNLNIDHTLLTEQDKLYIMLSNKPPERFHDKSQDSDS